MANLTSATARRARSKHGAEKQADRDKTQNGDGSEAAAYEQELAHYLQERIKPGLNPGSIPLLARSIAKEIARRRPDEDADVAGEPSSEEDVDVRGEADDDVHAEAGDESSSSLKFGNESSLEDEMRKLQANLGDDWILRVSVQGEDAWLTADKDDGSQHVEAPAADVLGEVVGLLNESGGRASDLREFG